MISRIILVLVVTFGATRAQNGCDSKADVTFLLDSSDNVGKENFKKQLNFIKDVTNNFQVGANKVQVSAVTYGTGATNQFYLNQYRDKIALQNAIDSIQFKGGQNKMANAIRFATGTSFSPIHGGRADAPHVAVLLTNEPSGTIDMTKLESQTARDNGLIVYTVGIGGAVDQSELMAIASNPDSRHMFTAQNFDALNSLSALLANKICNELPPDPAMLPAPTGCLKKADLVFMVDSSSSIGSTNFQRLEHFLKDVINKVDVGPNKVQVGVVKYASYPTAELSLGQYSTRPEVLKAIESMTYVGGGTNDGDAIAFTGNQVFSQNSGARGDVPRIGVIITDGGSSNPSLAAAAADKARTQNIGLISVGVGNGVNMYELNNLADKPSSSNVFTVNSYENLDTITDNLIKQMCTIKTSQPSLTGATLPPDPCQDKMANCDQYGTNVCTDYKQWAGENCARTCGICTPLFTVAPPKCEDNFPNCAGYGRDNCAVAGSFVQTNCKLFCGLCGSNTSPSGYYGKCSYKGKDYKTGEKWDDGCDYECICEDGSSGRYKCNNKCPVYHDLPSDCTLVAQPGKCCLEPVCNFNPTVNTQVSSGHGKTASGIDVCVFKGKQYFQDQFWRDGCDYQCQCTNAKRGTYKCDDLCPTYNSIPPYCHMEKKAGECCSKPVCEFDSQVGSFKGYGSISGNGVGATPTAHPPCLDALSNCNMYSKSVCFGTYRGWAAINCRKYCDMCPDGLPKPGPDDRCIFNGKLYSQGDKWNTSCSTTCTCENSIYGYYRCVDSCPTYNNVPSNCKTIKTAGQCCPTLRCDNGYFVSSQTNPITIGNGATFSVVNPPPGMIQVKPTLPTGETLPPGTGTSGFTPPTLGGCLYKGQLYYQDQAWEDGCQYTCICKDAGTGLYACKEKCPSYPVLPPSCHLFPDPNDVCCKSPTCTVDPVTQKIPVPLPVFQPAVQTYGQVVPPTLNELHNGLYTKTITLVPTGFTPAPPTIGTNFGTGGIGICTYRGQTYKQGQVWEDGCDFTCVCDDASRGHYQCTEKCVHYTNLPDQCYLIKDPSNPCCDIPKCNFVANYITHIGEVKTTTPRPLGEYCVYEGQRYQQGQTWYDGCSYKCTCEDAVENVYRCLSRCPEYENVDENCKFVPDPKDPSCCVMPECPETGHTQSPTPEPTPAPSGTFTGQGTGKGYCEYKSVHYGQGQRWQDGCDLTCTCTDAEAGFYRCSEACPRYVNIPEYCKLVTDFANPCCKKPRCTFPTNTGGITGTAPPKSTLVPTPLPPGQTPSPHVGPTAAPHYRYCLYKEVQYFQGQTWEDGCQYKCRCDNADKGLYVCNERCATYDTVPQTCTFVTDPDDTCCLVPSCPPATTPVPIPGSPTPSPGPYKIPTAAPGKVTGSANVPSPRPGVTPPPINYCEYKGRQYSQGQKWDDGCEFTCECVDERTGKYQCLEKCSKYVNLPQNCRLVKDPAQPCCSIPECGEPTPAPQGTPAPSAMPTPPQHVCVYKGNSYTQGQSWYDGCEYQCICEDEMTGLYTCNDRCAQYGQLPSECTLVPSSADPLCCKEPKCTFTNTKNQTTGYLTPPTPPPGVIHGGAATPTPLPSIAPSPGTPTGGPTPPPRNPVCVYKGNEYQTGQRWNDGCQYTCICDDGMTGHYTCTEMCSTFDDLPTGCRLVNDPYNPCCKKAYCPAKNVPTPAPPGQPSPSPTPKTGCMYNGVMFSKGEQWNDGCDLVCVCEDEVTGFYRCRDRCSKYDVAEGCTYVTDPRDSCCKVPYCAPVAPTPKPFIPGMIPTPAPGVTYAPNRIPTPAPGRTYAPGQFPTWVPGMVPTPAPGYTYAPEKIPTPAPGYTYAPGQFPTYVPGMVPTPQPGYTYAPEKIPTPAPGLTYAPGQFPTWIPGMVPTPAPGRTYAPNKIPTPAPGYTYAPGKFPTYVPGMVPTPAPGFTYAPNKIPTPKPGYTYPPGQFPTYVPGMVPTPAPGFTFAPNKIPTPAPGRTYAPGKFPTWVPGMVPTPAPGITYAPWKIPTPAPGSTYKPGYFPTYVPGMIPTPAPGFTYAPNKIPTPAPGSTYKPGYFPTYVPGMVPTPAPGVTYAPNKIPTPAPGRTYAPGQFPTWVPGMVPTPAPGYTFPQYLVPTPAPGKTYAPGQFPVYSTTPYPTPAPGSTYAPYVPGMVPTPAPGQTYAPNIIPTPAPGRTYAPNKFPTYVPGMVPTPAPGSTIPPWLIPGITPAPGSTYAPFHFPTYFPGMVPTPAPGFTYAPNKIPTPAPGKTYAPWNFPTYVPGMVPTPQPGYTYAPDKIPTPAPGLTYAPGMFPTWLPGMVPTPAPGFTYAPNKIPTPAPGYTYAPGQFPTYVPGMVPTPAPGRTFAPNKIPTPAPGYTYAPGQFPTYVPGMVPTPAPGFTYAPNKIPTPAPGSTYKPGYFPTYVPGMVPTPAPGFTYAPNKIPTPAPGSTYKPGYFPTYVPGMVPTPAPGVTFAPNKIPTPAPGRTYAPGKFPTWVPGMVPTPAPGFTYAPNMIPTPAPQSTYKPGYFPTYVPGMVPTPAPGITYAPNKIPTPAPGRTYAPGQFPTWVPGMVPTPAPGVTYAPNKIPTPAPGYTYPPGQFPTYVPGMVPTPAPGFTYAPNKIPTPAPGSTYKPGYFPTFVPGMIPTPAPGVTYAPNKIPTPAPGRTYAPGQFPTWVPGMVPTPAPGYTFPQYLVPTPAPGKTYAPGQFPVYSTSPYPTPAPGSTYAPYVPGMVPTPAPGQTYAPNIIPTPAPGRTYAPNKFPTYVPGMVPTPAPGSTIPPWLIPGITPAPGSTYAPFHFPTYFPGMVPTPAPGFTYAPNKIPTPAPGKTYAPWNFPTYVPGMVPTPQPGYTYAPDKIPTPAPGLTYAPGQFPTWLPGMVPTPAPGFTFAPNKIPTPAPGYTYAPGQFPTYVPGMVPTPAPGVTFAPNKIPTPAPGFTYAPGQFPTYVPGMVPTPAPGFTYAPNKIPTPAPGSTYKPGYFPTYLPGMVPTPAPGFTYAPNKIPTPAPGYTYAPGQFPTYVPGMVPTPAPGVTYAPNKIPTPAPGRTYAPGQFPTWVPGMVPTPAPGFTYAPNKIPTPAPGSTFKPGYFPTYVPGMVPTPAPGVTYAPYLLPTPAPGRTYAPGQYPTWVPGMVPTPAPGVTYAPNKIPTPAPGRTYAPGRFPTYVPGMVPTPQPGFTYAPGKIPTPAPGLTYAPGQFPTWLPGMVPTPAPGFTYAPNKIPTPAPGYTYAPGKFPTYVPGMVPTPAPGFTYAPNKIPTPAPGYTYAPGQFPTYVPGMVPTPAPGVTYAPNKIPTPAPGRTYAPGQFPTWVPGMVPTPAPGYTFPQYLVPTPSPGKTYAPGKFPVYSTSPYPTPAPGSTYAPYVPGMVPTPAPGQTYAPNIIPTPAPGRTYAPNKFPTYVPGMVPTPAPGVTIPPWLIPGITPAPGSTYAPFHYPTYIPGMVPTPAPGFTYAPNKIPTPAPGKTYAPWNFPTYVPGMVPTPQPGYTYAPDKIPTPAPGLTYAPGMFPTWLPGMVPTPAPGFTYAPNKIPTPAPGYTYAPGQFPTYVPGMVPTPAPGFTYAPNKIPTPAPGYTYAPGQFPTYVPGMVPTPAPGVTYAPNKIPTPAPGYTYAPGQFPTYVPGMVPTPQPGFTYAPNKIPTPAPGYTYAPGQFPTWVPGMVPTPAPGVTYAPNMIPTPALGYTYSSGQFPTWVPGMVPTPAPGVTYAPNKIPTPAPGYTYSPGQFPTWVPGMVPTPAPGKTYAPNLVPTPGIGLTYAPGKFPTPSPAPTPFPVPTAIPGVFQGSGVNANVSGCVHYGVVYKQGDVWQDGCKYDCECLDDHTGRYQCKERCPLFLNLPSYCRLVVNPNDVCCKIPVCNTPAPATQAPQPTPGPTPGPGPNPTPGPGPNPTPGPGPNPTPGPTPGLVPTPQPKEVCIMNGKQYVAGQTWYMGCDQRCVCEDGKTGFYRCYDRCAQYNNVSPDCTMVPDPKDPTCCKVPQCIPVPGPGKTVPTDKPFSVTGVPGVVSGHGIPPTPGTGGFTSAPRNVCIYNGRMYTQGQKWQDGCKYDCICSDGLTGKYECTERCAAFPFVPPECQMRRDPNDVCCFRPICDYNQTVPTPGPFQPSPSPGVSTINPLPPSYCVYKGVPYSQGQTWDDGCVKKCRCDDADMNIYTCFDRCKSYNTGPGCVMVSDPMDSCCQVPKCTKVPPTAGPTVCPFPMPTAVPGVITGGPQPDPVTGVAPSNLGYCEYRGAQYQQGASWDDGCSYHCSCIDSSSGQYQCQERCPRFVGLPSYCKMAQDPNDKCCTKPACDVCPSTPVPGVFTPTPGPSQGPTPAPQPKNVCIMNGKQYKEGQKWYVGCDKICICDDGQTGAYSCTERCPSYPNIAGCTMVPDPRDPICCQAPKCPGNTGVIGVVNGSGTPPPPTSGPDVTGTNIPSTSPAPKVCVYKGKFYTQGQKWQDGCAFDCECLDADSGNFKCVDRCPRYPNLPSSCMLVYDPSNPCCQKPSCPTATPTPGPGQTPAPTVSPPSEFCVYQGVPFRQGQKFNQGCDKICVCEDAMTGKITCNDRCQTFPPLPANCTTVTDPNDVCCQIPNCFNPNTVTQTGVQGTFTGSNLPNTNNPYSPTGSRNVCVYNGKMYTQGQTWDDGCSYTCECLDSAKGLYKCTDKCQKFPPMPSYCRMVQDSNNKCCQTPLCNPPNPNFTPTPGTVTQPPQNMCVYKGNRYQQGQQWYDGCDFMCRCEDASANFYRCQQRCATYTKQTGCTLVPDPKDPTCCEIPNCPLTPPGPSPSPGFVSPNPGGVINGMGPTPSPGGTIPGSRKGCVYKGMVFHQGDKFDDGCEYQCECLDDNTGKYKCVEKCQTFPSLPKYCTLIQDKNEPCCKVPYCDYGPNPVLPTQGPQLIPTPQPGVSTVAPYVTPSPPGINTTPRPSINPSPTPQPTGYCVYKGVYYTQGQTWDDGCQLRCRCEDVQKGYYSCNQRCATYPASSCPMRADPMDACCLIPDCNTGKIPTPMPTPGPGQSTLNPTVTPEPISGTFTGNSGGVQPGTGPGTSGSRNICVYKSKVYTQGQKWQDGCSFNCECVDASRGKYVCNDRCPKYPYLPPYCHWKQSTGDVCCREPVCNTYIQPTTIAPPTTPTTQTIVTIAPPDKCVYTNGMQYSTGATWTISCSVTCECIDSATNNFQCTDRCPVFSSLPSICTLVKDPADQCCMKPQCTLPTGVTMTPLTGYGPSGSAPPPTSLQVIPLGTHTVFTGYGKPKPGTVGSGQRDRCVYKGSLYTQGQSWDDGCTYVCTCENQNTGMYRCWNKCPTYPQLPAYCKSVSVPGQCCKSITCDIPGYGTYQPVPQLVPTPLPPGATFPPTNSHIILAPPTTATVGGKYPGGGYYLPDATNPNVIGSIRDKCMYKSRLYNQGETWEDGCDFHCECLDQRAGYYACKPLCPVYNNLPSNKCYLVTAYGQCCSQPMCYDPSKGIAVNPLTSGKFPVVGTYTGGFSGFRPGYTGNNKGACIYKGKSYSKGQKWDDGCEFECTCMDDTTGLYQCNQKCPSYTNIPPLCKLETQPGSCCKRITCTQVTGGTLPPNYSTVMPASTAQPQIDKDCYDRINNCKDYGKQACGSTYLAWAQRNCNASCGFCTPKYSTTPPPCIDKLNDCQSFGRSSCIGIYEPWAKDNCRKYCGYCGTGVPVSTPTTIQTTPPPCGQCQDKLDTCALLDKSYYCSGSFRDWAIQNCQKTCDMCCVSIVNTTPKPTTPSPSSWLLFMKGVSGAPGPDLYQLWHSPQTINTNVPAASRLTNEFNGHYKPDYSNHWKEYCIDQVKVSVYNNGVEKAYIVFNATGADKESWFTNDRIMYSSYTDIKTTSKDVMSMQGSASLGREFYISGHTSATDTCDAFGWMMISTNTGCHFEAADKKPTFYYAPGTTQAHWGFTNPLKGDVFAIQAHPTCFQATSAPHTTQAPYCDYKGKQYTQGQYWQDGCQYNCTCEDASVGFYKCTDLCPRYSNLPAGCALKTKPGDCCAQPDCPNPGVSIVTQPPIVIVGGGGCIYKGKTYGQDQTWNDGCSSTCTCTDAKLGLYSCRGLCLTWNNLPAVCHLDDAPPGLCCQQPKCPSSIIVTVPKGFEKQYPGITVQSG